MNHEERKAKADEKAAPDFYYTYVLRFEDTGDFYVGSTNNPAARFTEHAVGVGAVATSGRQFTVCLVHQFGSRREAEYNEERIQSALDKGPVNVEAMIDNFKRISMMIRPEKTFNQLRREQERYDSEQNRYMHISKAQRTVCGWEIPWNLSVHRPNPLDIASFVQKAREEDALRGVGSEPPGMPVCRRCLAKVEHLVT